MKGPADPAVRGGGGGLRLKRAPNHRLTMWDNFEKLNLSTREKLHVLL